MKKGGEKYFPIRRNDRPSSVQNGLIGCMDPPINATLVKKEEHICTHFNDKFSDRLSLVGYWMDVSSDT